MPVQDGTYQRMAPEKRTEDVRETGHAGRVLLVASAPGWLAPGVVNLGGRLVEVAHACPGAQAKAMTGDWDVVAFVADGQSDGPPGVLAELREIAPDATLLALAEKPDIREAVQYLKGGVYEYLPLPLEGDQFARAVEEALDTNEAYREILELNRLLVDEKEELAAKNRELTAISDVARAVSHSLELDEVLDRLVECIEQTFDFDRVTIGLVNYAERREETRMSRGVNALATSGAQWDISNGANSAWVAVVYGRGLVMRADDPAHDLVVAGSGLATLHGGPFAKIPMLSRGNVVGTITVDNHRSGAAIGDGEVGVLRIFADTAAIAVENAHLFQMVKELSLRDELTGLYNRRFLTERALAEVVNAERRELPVTFVMADLDHFKMMNDANDHLTGDAALKKVARTIEGLTRGVDIVARYGGEELVVVLPSTDLATGVTVAEKLRSALESTAFDGEGALPGGKLTASFGVATYPDHGKSYQEVMESADHALYRAKNEGRNRVVAAG